MNFTQTLLRLDPHAAIVAMLNDENQTNFRPDVFRISAPTVVDGRSTRVTLTARRPASKLDDVPYTGSLDYTFNRLDLNDQFNGVLTGFRPTLPCSTQTVLDELTRLTGQQFYLDDVVHEEIERYNAAPYRIKAKAESLRWVGELQVTLIDLVDLNDFFNDHLPFGLTPRLGSFDTTAQLTSAKYNLPFLNATALRETAAALPLHEGAEEVPALVDFVKRTVPAPGEPLDHTNSPWHVSPVPAPYNLYGAKVRATATARVGVNRVNRELDRTVDIELSAHCTNFSDRWLRVPYSSRDFNALLDFTDQPRLSRYTVTSIVDGSAYALQFNSLTAGYVFTPGVGPSQYTFNGYGPWTNTGVAGKKSVTNAVVLYNGPRRSTDAPPADPSLNRTLSALLSDNNQAYRGSFVIHYRAPIALPFSLPNAVVGYDYPIDLAPTGGRAPYTLTLLSGGFAPGHVFDPVAATVRGMATATGTFKPALRVTDADGVSVDYRYQYRVTALPLSVVGQAPNGRVGEPYLYSYKVEGGYKPYSAVLESGSLPFGVTLDGSLVRLSGTLQEAGLKSWLLWVTDAKGNSVRLSNDVLVS